MPWLLGALLVSLVLGPQAWAAAWGIELAWERPVAGSPSGTALVPMLLTGYLVDRRPGPAAEPDHEWQVAATVQTLTDAIPGVGPWCYQVKALYGTVQSVPNTPLCVQVPSAPLLERIALASEMQEAGMVTLEIQWRRPEAPGNVVTGYLVEKASAESPAATIAAESTVYTVNDTVAVNTPVCYQVVAQWQHATEAWKALSEPSVQWCVRVAPGGDTPGVLSLGVGGGVLLFEDPAETHKEETDPPEDEQEPDEVGRDVDEQEPQNPAPEERQ